MQEIARAVREGAIAYLRRQFRTVFILILIITFVLIFTANPNTDAGWHVPIGRGIAFFIGAIFSATVGGVGMYLATAGNLPGSPAARGNLGYALPLWCPTGATTRLLT